jgi:dienelactone hydrolase
MTRLPAGVVAALLLLAAAPSAGADMSSLEAACGAHGSFTFCDDGVPAAGGTTANPGAEHALAAPQRYGGDGFTGLPPKAAAEPGSGADAGGDIALDADLSLPRGAAGRMPLMVLMHTCCSADKRNFESPTPEAAGETWRYNNAWFASRGYAVLTYTSRGFVDGQGHGSTGETQLDSRRYEVNDLQQLACLVAGQRDLDPTRPGDQQIDPARVVVSGGSYGGGLAWLAATDPVWTCAGAGHPGVRMRLAAAAPKYAWTDLLYAIVPNGSHRSGQLPPGDPGSASTKRPLGVPHTSIVAALYGTGKAGDPRSGGRATFSADMDRSIACLSSTTPLEENPLCTATGVVPRIVDEFLSDRSAYYQSAFFRGLERRTVDPVPVFSAGSMSSPLFGQVEHRRMVDRLEQARPGYPVQEYYGDIGDFTQNKAKEWADVPGQAPRLGVNTRLNRFVDHYARPAGDLAEPRPAFDATAALQICPANAGGAFPADQPGERFTASSFAALAPERLRLQATGSQGTTFRAAPNQHATNADPIANFAFNGGACPVERTPAGAGVAVYDFAPLAADAVMIGRPRVTVPHSGTGSDLQLDARLYEVLSDGSQVLVDRGGTRLAGPDGTAVFDLNGNAWRFTKGHSLRLELAQDDDPYFKASTRPSSLTLAGATLDLPVRRAGPDAVIASPALASDASTGRRFPVRVGARSGELTGVTRTEALVRDVRARRARSFRGTSFRGRAGHTYRFAARLFDRRGMPGAYSRSETVVPFDDRSSRVLRYRGRWRRAGSRRAWGRRLTRSSRRGARMSFRFRGRRLYVIGRVGRRGGTALARIGRVRRLVRFRARRSRNRRVVLRVDVRGRRPHRLRLRVVRGRVELDALAVR